MVVINAENARVGRLATHVTKELLKGNEVHIINAEKAIISGNPKDIHAKYLEKRSFQYKGEPSKSPKWPKVPHLFVRRLIRGMLPRKKAKGRAAYKKLKVYAGAPETVKGEVKVIKEADKGALNKYISIRELCRLLGHQE
ncbi:MAG: 50S ribosomal protein L13 [Candidatus ainarchaeum sp.]|nr:50S ribosomal protein L13 [Candidatus ainarchaeum sp.]MDD5095934.1 50S ribosomal protein L13 [Candidatus ainarchaeum sp.]